jgi:hypothetical protein
MMRACHIIMRLCSYHHNWQFRAHLAGFVLRVHHADSMCVWCSEWYLRVVLPALLRMTLLLLRCCFGVSCCGIFFVHTTDAGINWSSGAGAGACAGARCVCVCVYARGCASVSIYVWAHAHARLQVGERLCTCLGLFGRVKVLAGVKMGEEKAGLRRLARRLMRVATMPTSSAPTPLCVCAYSCMAR